VQPPTPHREYFTPFDILQLRFGLAWLDRVWVVMRNGLGRDLGRGEWVRLRPDLGAGLRDWAVWRSDFGWDLGRDLLGFCLHLALA